jgi:hypothetical protein
MEKSPIELTAREVISLRELRDSVDALFNFETQSAREALALARLRRRLNALLAVATDVEEVLDLPD